MLGKEKGQGRGAEVTSVCGGGEDGGESGFSFFTVVMSGPVVARIETPVGTSLVSSVLFLAGLST